MQKIIIKSKIRNYQVKFPKSLDFVINLSNQNSLFVIDENVFSLYKSKIINIIPKNKLILHKSSEKTKTLTYAGKLYSFLLNCHATRNHLLIAIGGGALQDVAGFVASTFYRGINWIYLPTTFLAQTDSCIGGKTSLNYKNYKNIIGTFYPPKEIYIAIDFLKTINDREFHNGLGEMIKLQLIGTRQNLLAGTPSKINQLTRLKSKELFEKLIYKSLLIKKAYIEEDEFDLGKRTLLNYGHTLGHALESTSNFQITHGIAVIIGMLFANIIAVNRGLIKSQLFKFLTDELFIPNMGELNLSKEYFNEKKLLEQVKKDKKRITNHLSFVLLKNNLNLEKVDNITDWEFYNSLSKLSRILKAQKLK